MFYIFGAVNALSIPIGTAPHPSPLPPSVPLTLALLVYSLYPESNQRTLEEMDWLFSADKPWAWEAEKNFKLLKEQNPDIVRSGSVVSINEYNLGKEKASTHVDRVEV